LSNAAITKGTPFKCAAAWAANDFAVDKDNGTVGVDASGSVPNTITRLCFGDDSSAATPTHTMSRFIWVPRRMTNAQLQAATT
jgi:hypothetical protein